MSNAAHLLGPLSNKSTVFGPQIIIVKNPRCKVLKLFILEYGYKICINLPSEKSATILLKLALWCGLFYLLPKRDKNENYSMLTSVDPDM